MARQKAVKTAAEIKAEKKNLQTVIKEIDAGLKPHAAALAAAEKDLAAAKKAADKSVAAAQKAVTAATAKLVKAQAAADKGRGKLQSQLAALEPAAPV